jgi:hypothetical protein
MKKCQLCSRLSFGLRKFLSLLGIGLDCEGLNLATDYSNQRVSDINSRAPSCSCEKYRMSRYSPSIVENSEHISLFVFLPMHKTKDGKALPSIFSHVHLLGRSVQRESVATKTELIEFTQKFLNADIKRVWEGVLLAKCDDIRNIKLDETLNRSVCMYDTALKDNPAHAEICQTQHIEEADQNELRHQLLVTFDNGNIVKPIEYWEGLIWNGLPNEIQSR